MRMARRLFAFCGSVTKQSKIAFPLRAIDGLLRERGLTLCTTESTREATIGLATVNRDQAASATVAPDCPAILLISPASKDPFVDSFRTWVERQPTAAWKDKAVALIVIGGYPGHASDVENSLRPVLRRLGVNGLVSLVHLSAGNWILVSDDRPRLARCSEKSIRDTLNLLLPDTTSRNARAAA
jgi:hypothetical protein